MVTRKISDIKIGVRHRKDMGDIAGLTASIEAIGLLHLVVINKSDELIAGERRIRAYEALGRDEIPVTVVDIESVEIVLGENAENEQHKPFTVSERVAIGKEVERALGNRQRQRTDLSNGIGKVEHTDEAAAKKAGFGNPETYRQAKTVVAAAEAEPDKFGALAEQMDTTGKVQPAHKQLKELKRSPADIEKANRAGKAKSRKHKLTPEEKELVDRTEKITDAKAATEVSKKVTNIIEQFEMIDLGPVARMSDDERTELMTQITGAMARLDKTLIKIAISGGANLGVLSPPNLRYQALAFMRGSIARIETELTGRDVQESAT